MRCYLHVGMEKTGTTSIQATLAVNRARLLDSGYMYPRSLGATNHTNLVAYALDDRRTPVPRTRALAAAGKDLVGFRRWLEQELVDEVRGAGSATAIVCSNEHLQSSLATIAEKQRLKSLLDRVADSYRVIVYLRRQDEVARSRYSTALKSGSTDLDLVLPAYDEVPYFYDYRRWLEEFSEVFGRETLDVRLFERDELADGDVVGDLLGTIGYPDPAGIERVPSSNASIELDAQYFMAVFNRENPVRVDGRPSPGRGRIADEIGELFPGPGRTVDRDEAERFLELFDETNEWVRGEFFPDHAQLFSRDLSDYPERAETSYDIDRVATIGARLLERRQARIDELRDPGLRAAARSLGKSLRRLVPIGRHRS